MNKYRKADGKYNGLIRILTNPLFLQACYLEIKSKGNMTPSGTNQDTLDGIKLKWFENTASDLLSGRFNFAPARVMIPALALPLSPPPLVSPLKGGIRGGGDYPKESRRRRGILLLIPPLHSVPLPFLEGEGKGGIRGGGGLHRERRN